MAHITRNRIQETSTTTGTGNLTLAGAIAGFQTFASRMSVADTCWYSIEAVDAYGIPTGSWEVGLGTYSATNTLTRTAVYESSNSDAVVSFAAGTKRIALSVAAPNLSSAANWRAALSAQGVDDLGFVTGDFKFRQAAAANTGWIAGDGSTIGNVGSGATRANLDTLALFTLWWTDYSNAQLPILTSAGGASTRGASAAADWAALKRLTVFDVRGRFARAAGTINSVTIANGTVYSDTFKQHTHSNTMVIGNNSGPTVTNLGPGSSWTVDSPSNTGTSTDAKAGLETAPASIGMLACFKL